MILERKDIFKAGAFVLNSTVGNSSLFEENSSIFVTQDGTSYLKNQIISMIAGATKVIKVCSFIVTDKEIFELLLKRTREDKIPVFVLTQLDPSKLFASTMVTEEEAKEHTGKIHLAYIKKLYDNGAHVRASVSAHAKFIVCDKSIGFIMSANLTTPSLKLNTESGTYLNSEDVPFLDRLFDVIYQKGTTFRQYVNATKKGKSFVVQSESTFNPDWLPKTDTNNLRYTYEKLNQSLYKGILEIVATSKEFLFISTYSIVGLSHLGEFIQQIKEARARGVVIKIFCRAMNYRSDHVHGCKTLYDLGCEVFGDTYNHSKGILNEKSGMLFTANIDGNHGLLNGFEVGYMLGSDQRTIFLNFHKHLIAGSPYQFVNDPSRGALFNMYESYEKIKGLKAPVFESQVKIVVKKELSGYSDDLSNSPIFFGRTKGKTPETYIIAGYHGFKCEYRDGTFILLEKSKIDFNVERYILKYEQLQFQYL